MDVIERLKSMAEESNIAVQHLIDLIVTQMERDEMTNQEAGKYLFDLADQGVISGILPMFIYREDCDKFFSRHYRDILEDLEYEFDYKGSYSVENLLYGWIDSWSCRLFNELCVIY